MVKTLYSSLGQTLPRLLLQEGEDSTNDQDEELVTSRMVDLWTFAISTYFLSKVAMCVYHPYDSRMEHTAELFEV